MSSEEVGKKYGFRSGLEKKVAAQIEAKENCILFETTKIKYVKPESNHKYTPDFILQNGIIIETKGRFTTADRQKHLLIKKQKPALDIRFVFCNPNTKISKISKTTYAMWCKKHGFKFAKGYIPDEWFNERGQEPGTGAEGVGNESD